jgi:hypothetical protein
MDSQEEEMAGERDSNENRNINKTWRNDEIINSNSAKLLPPIAAGRVVPVRESGHAVPSALILGVDSAAAVPAAPGFATAAPARGRLP